MAITDHHLGFDGDEAVGPQSPEIAAPAPLDRLVDAADHDHLGTTPGRAVRALASARRRRPVAWLRQVVDAYGEPRDDGLVDVPLSQAELSEASGRARVDVRVIHQGDVHGIPQPAPGVVF